MPSSDDNWRATAAPLVNDSSTSFIASRTDLSNPRNSTNVRGYPKVPLFNGLSNSTSYNSYYYFQGGFANPTSYNSYSSAPFGIATPWSHKEYTDFLGGFGDPMDYSGSANHVNDNINVMTPDSGSFTPPPIADYHKDSTLSHDPLSRGLLQEITRMGRASISTLPGLRTPVVQKNSIANNTSRAESSIYDITAGTSNRPTEGHGYFDNPASSDTFSMDSHPKSSQESVSIDSIESESNMAAIYGLRQPRQGEMGETIEDVVKYFLAPFEVQKGQRLAKRMLINWSQSQIRAMAKFLTGYARNFCTKYEDRGLVTPERVLWLRKALVWGGLCVEPRICRPFIVEGCRMLASFSRHDTEYRTVQKLMSCFSLMLTTVIVAHPLQARESVPIWELQREISIAESQFTSRDEVDENEEVDYERLPGSDGIFTDAKGIERPMGAVLMGKKYCTIDGCITCGFVHLPSYFMDTYPDLARVILEKEESDYIAKILERQQESQNNEVNKPDGSPSKCSTSLQPQDPSRD